MTDTVDLFMVTIEDKQMKYLFAIIIPPVAVIMCGKPLLALLNFILWLCFIFPGIIHALFVVVDYQAEQRVNQLERLIQKRESGRNV